MDGDLEIHCEPGLRDCPKPKLQNLFKRPYAPQIRVKQKGQGAALGCLSEPHHQPSAGGPPTEPWAHLPPHSTHPGPRSEGRKALRGGVGTPGHEAHSPIAPWSQVAEDSGSRELLWGGRGTPPTPKAPPRSPKKK